MATTEFDIIRDYFTPRGPGRADVIAGVGDDAALLAVPPGMELAVCMDTLVSGVHFAAGTAPSAIGHKALAVNLSDLAAMGAEPAWATLSLTVPGADPDWLGEFSRGFSELAGRYGVELVGGDLSRGPLSITVQAHGFVPAGRAVPRHGGKPGDLVCVTGTLGDAGLALHLRRNAGERLLQRLDRPQPRIEAGIVLRDFATAMIDVSDGLLADLGHLLEGAAAGATLHVDALPRSADFLAAVADLGEAAAEPLACDLPLCAGDDYELCFCIPESRHAAMERALAAIPCPVTVIGVLEVEPGIRCRLGDGRSYRPAVAGWLHFDGTDAR